jgi:hypothetical protein
LIKIAFLGCDSTHTEAFAERINFIGARFSDVAKVVSIWGEDLKQAQIKAVALNISRVASTPEEALQDVDFAMVIGRFGESHYEPAMTALRMGIPTFIDKPFTVSSNLAEQLIGFAKTHKINLGSSSPLRFSREVQELKSISRDDYECIVVTVPASCTDLGTDPRLNSCFFYGIHGLEVLLEVIGFDLKSCSINYGEKAIVAMLQFETGKVGILELIRKTQEFYEVGVYGPNKNKRINIALDESYYDMELEALIGGGFLCENFIPIESALEAVKLLETIDRDDPYR